MEEIKNQRLLKKEVSTRLLDALVKDESMNDATYKAILRELESMYQLGAEKYHEKTGHDSVMGLVCSISADDPRWHKYLAVADRFR